MVTPEKETFVQGDLGHSAAPQVLITRHFNAPRALVFEAWTDPAHLRHWYAPHGCTIEFRHIDVRTGGTFHSCIHTPDGHQCWCTGVYRAIVAPERIVYTLVAADAAGKAVEPAEVGMDPDWPRETLVTVTFESVAGGTRLTLAQTVLESLAKRTGAHPSWLQMLDRLDEQLANAAV